MLCLNGFKYVWRWGEGGEGGDGATPQHIPTQTQSNNRWIDLFVSYFAGDVLGWNAAEANDAVDCCCLRIGGEVEV